MQSNMLRGSRFATSALILFSLGSVSVLILEIAERNDVISDLSESTFRLAICSTLVGVLVFTSRSLSRLAKLGVLICAGLVLIELSLDVIEDVAYLDGLPLVGHDSRWRHTIEKTVVCCWTCGVFFLLMYSCVRVRNHSVNSRPTRQT